MEKHIKVARAHGALAWFYAAIATLVLVLLMSLRDLKTPIGLYLMVFLLGALAALHFAVAKGAREGRNGARVASLIMGVLMLPAIPVGTLIGVYLLVNTAGEWDGAASSGVSTQ